jgi:CheY-like chemotaxis protein
MMAREHSIRIVIADDHYVVLQGLANLIGSDPNFTLLASCPDGEQCLRAIRHFGPDIAVVDMTMPIMNGLEVLARHCGAPFYASRSPGCFFQEQRDSGGRARQRVRHHAQGH